MRQEQLEGVSGASAIANIALESPDLEQQQRVRAQLVSALPTGERLSRLSCFCQTLRLLRQLPGFAHRRGGGDGLPRGSARRRRVPQQKSEPPHQPHRQEPCRSLAARGEHHERINGRRAEMFHPGLRRTSTYI